MDCTLIKNFNKKISPNDILYFLGDFSMSDNFNYSAKILSNLNGKKIFVKGNHDNPKLLNALKQAGLIEAWYDAYGLKYENEYIWLSHYAHRTWNKSHRGSWHLYGHTHGTISSFGKSFDVGVDANNYEPLSFNAVKIKISQLEIANMVLEREVGR
jgi:calcineurin-like phosphoesterase family protein